MVLRAIGPRAGKPAVQHAQLADLSDVELLPSMRRTALALAADLKTEQTLDAMSDAIVVRLDGSGPPGSVDELDETLVNDRANEIVIHGTSRIARTAKRPVILSEPLSSFLMAERSWHPDQSGPPRT